MNDKIKAFFEVKVNIENFEIVTANNQFYDFLGDRLYYTFDRLLLDGESDKIIRVASGDDYNGCFILHLCDNENNVYDMICKVLDKTNNIVSFVLVEINYLYDSNFELHKKETKYLAILGQSDSIYYSYDSPSNIVTCYDFKNSRKVLASINLDTLVDMIGNQEKDEVKELALQIKMDLVMGKSNFTYNCVASHKIFNNDSEHFRVTGTAIFVKGKHVSTVGEIIFEDENNSQKLIRKDQLTGLMLKEDITDYARNRIEVLKKKTTIAIIDIDDFKNVNDSFGHMKGDEVLRRCASIINDEVKQYGAAGRIGGDEFFIVLDDMDDTEQQDKLRTLLRSIKNSIGSAYTMESDGFVVTTSIGCASYPCDIDNFKDLFVLADYLLYRAKNKGKNRYIIYNIVKHGSVEQILSQGLEAKIGINVRKGLSKGEIVCKIIDKYLLKEQYTAEMIFNDIIDYFGVERVILYNTRNGNMEYQGGNNLLSKALLRKSKEYVLNEEFKKAFNNDKFIVNNIKQIENDYPSVYNTMNEQGILSFMQYAITGESGNSYLISYEAVLVRMTWNTDDMHFFRILNHMLSKCL